jgi:hypothetical protein
LGNFGVNADPDPDFRYNADPDPASKNNADPCRSESATLILVVLKLSVGNVPDIRYLVFGELKMALL